MLLDRKKRAGKHLEWKVRLFSVAAVFALAGIYTENRWLTGSAIALLLAAFLLRFLPGDAPDEDPADSD
jgi:hypothetical protein